MSDRTPIIRDVLAEHGRLGTDAALLGEGDSLYEAGLTSHASVNVMLALEDEFGIEFPERFLMRSTFETIGNLGAVLNELLGVDA